MAQGVGLTTASVTYYYRRKEDLAAACLLRAIETLDAIVSEAWAQPSPPERLTDLVARYLARLADAAEGRAPALITFWDLRALSGPQAAAVMGTDQRVDPEPAYAIELSSCPRMCSS